MEFKTPFSSSVSHVNVLVHHGNLAAVVLNSYVHLAAPLPNPTFRVWLLQLLALLAFLGLSCLFLAFRYLAGCCVLSGIQAVALPRNPCPPLNANTCTHPLQSTDIVHLILAGSVPSFFSEPATLLSGSYPPSPSPAQILLCNPCWYDSCQVLSTWIGPLHMVGLK